MLGNYDQSFLNRKGTTMSTNIGPRRLGKYELRELVGRGGIAEVWKAFDTHLQRFVAIKLLHDQHNRSRNPMGEPLLSDFGIAKLLGTSTSLASGSWSGAELYLSPEQAQGYVGNERSDLYALGVILYELCTGSPPFQGESPTLVLSQHVSGTPIAPALLNPAIPPPLSMVILRGLAKDPAARFPSASAMAQAVAQALNVDLPEDLTTPVSAP